MFNAICGTFFADEGAVILDGTDITYEKEYKRSKYIGHLFQDPMKGTAPNMSIEENLALAYLRASAVKGKFFSRISQKEKQMFREKLALLDMGLEDRMKNPVVVQLCTNTLFEFFQKISYRQAFPLLIFDIQYDLTGIHHQRTVSKFQR